ncbi:alpha/beta fold hydrolase [Massilia solisilvae]|uniref:Alpha/beta fold hydrolase n=1 Tax=Massilia solisilvae TaxID=1811225 RepID=A0ABT2BHM2_9BURK|nr:alpha/beta fold hydrolase [Massilia solisilvae]MCS0607921.1 alpha/beta fold hydrolase [Massilia solisilvae]
MDKLKLNLAAVLPPAHTALPATAPHTGSGDDIETPSRTDRVLHAALGRLTSGISPAAMALAWTDWALHLSQSPGKWARLCEKATTKAGRFGEYAVRAAIGGTEPCIAPLPQDHRFSGPAWQRWPFNVMQQGFLLNQQWWYNVTTGIGGVSPHHEQVVSFVARQALDMFSPVNYIATNPEVLEATLQEGGQNLVRGATHLADDWRRMLLNQPPAGADQFVPGQQVAVTPGQVVLRNRLIELIQYSPTTPDVHAEPILIVPAWIMKYYILDLSPQNSLVKYLADRGHTVFMISWHNPVEADRDLGMDDYLRMGVLAALDAVAAIVPDRGINTVGYCLGGTLLAIAAAWLAGRRDQRIHSMTLLAAQTDFTEAGELRLFIDDSQLNYLEDIMWRQGYLQTRQMAGAFQLLRSNDLVWSRVVNEYLLGKRQPMNDLMAWNADATRMPYRMHSEYLRRLFLKNDLFEGRYRIDDAPVALADIHVPMFVVATETDHVAPWKSVYKINLVAGADVTFVLTSGGHNAGIVSEPGHRNRHYRLARRTNGDTYLAPDDWVAATAQRDGSWWPAWTDWLESSSSGRIAPPTMGAAGLGYVPICAAPGQYVLER